MKYYTYVTDDRDYSEEDQRKIHIGLDTSMNIWFDITTINNAPQNPILIPKTKSALHRAFLNMYRCIKNFHEPDNKFLSYYDLLDQVNAWRSEFGKPEQFKNIHERELSNYDSYVTYYAPDDATQKHFDLILGGNGDWYFSVHQKANSDCYGVRLATSGGASWKIPHLSICVANIYHLLSINNEVLSEDPNEDELENELTFFSKKYPEYFYCAGFIIKNPKQ